MSNLVEDSIKCPNCGERDADKLVIDEDDVECTTCNHVYSI